jgi:hypothetical protein
MKTKKETPTPAPIDDARVRHLRAIYEEARALPSIVFYLRSRYPNELSTPALIAFGKSVELSAREVRSQLKSDRVRKKAGTAHGTLNTDICQYRPTAAETPWKPEYLAGVVAAEEEG